MTDKEMAEEYAAKQNLQNVNISGIVRCKIADGFLAGLKAGRPQWHDLRKDPNDLPKDDKQYLVLFYYNYKGKKEMSYGVRDNLHRDFEIHSNYTEQIIAWCEIPTFDKE